MVDSYIQHRIYLQQLDMLKNRQGFEIVPLNFNYQDMIIIATGLIEYGGRKFVFQSNSCGCGPQPTIRGAFFEEVIPWHVSGLHDWFAACKTKDRKLAEQKIIDQVYRVRLPDDEKEREELTAALRSHFGEEMVISFF